MWKWHFLSFFPREPCEVSVKCVLLFDVCQIALFELSFAISFSFENRKSCQKIMSCVFLRDSGQKMISTPQKKSSTNREKELTSLPIFFSARAQKSRWSLGGFFFFLCKGTQNASRDSINLRSGTGLPGLSCAKETWRKKGEKSVPRTVTINSWIGSVLKNLSANNTFRKLTSPMT